jgi:hypothetical protein
MRIIVPYSEAAVEQTILPPKDNRRAGDGFVTASVQNTILRQY